MQQLMENFGAIYFFVLSIVIVRYIFSNWNKNKVEAKFIASGGRELMKMLVSL